MGFFSNLIDDFTGQTATKAARAQEAGIAQGKAVQNQRFKDTRDTLSPFIDAGGAARNRLLALLGLPGGDGTSFDGTPGFQFAVNEGQRGVSNALAAGGLRGSGRAIKEATRFGQQSAFADRGNEIARLLGLSGAGQTAATNLGSLGQNNANALASLAVDAGNARGAGITGAGNARIGGINNLLKFGGQIAGRF